MDHTSSRRPSNLHQVSAGLSPVSRECRLGHTMRTLGDNDTAVNVLRCLRQTEPREQVLCTVKVPFESAEITMSVNAEFFKFIS